jgi:hypothetical protein
MIPNEAGCLFSLTDRMGDDADPKEIFGPDAEAHRIHQPGGRGTHWSGVAAGYHAFVDSLESPHRRPYRHQLREVMQVIPKEYLMSVLAV